MSDVTQILKQIESGDPAAPEQLLPLVHDEFGRLAPAGTYELGSPLGAVHEALTAPGRPWSSSLVIHQCRIRSAKHPHR